MTESTGWGVVGVLFAAGIWMGSGAVWAAGGPGAGMPSPFDFNSKVELASGESYVLIGTLVQDPKSQQPNAVAQFALHVDLDRLPWLATPARRSDPFYPLILGTDSSQNSELAQMVGVEVVAAGKALGRIQPDASGNPEYVIYFKPENSGIEPASSVRWVGSLFGH